MATKTISSHVSTQVDLGNYAPHYLEVTDTGAISAGTAVFSAVVGTVSNYGVISGMGIGGTGIQLTDGGTVTNQSGGTVYGFYTGITISGAAGEVVNAGTIFGIDKYGIYLGAGGSVTNSGSIFTNGYGIDLAAGGAVTNQHGGLVSATGYGVSAGAAATVVNDGTIEANGGIRLNAGGAVTNQLNGVIAGHADDGIHATGSATVVNAGTINGGGGYSVLFGSCVTNLLVVDPGAKFGGVVTGGGVGSTMELAPAASVGTLSGLGTQYLDFDSIIIAPKAQWNLTGNNTLTSAGSLVNYGTLTLRNADLVDADVMTNNGVIVLDPSTLSVAALIGIGAVTIGANAIMPGGTLKITGTLTGRETIAFNGARGVLQLSDPFGFDGQIDFFAGHETISLPGIVHSAGDTATVRDGHTLVLKTVKNGTFDLLLNPAIRMLTSNTYDLASLNGGTAISAIPCYVAGTSIRTLSGEVAVEALRIGDLLVTRGGTPRAVRWIGRRSYAARVVAANPTVQPICVRAGALGSGLPLRDLYVSPQHALHFEDGSERGMLVPAAALVNGGGIARCPRFGDVQYLHVELAVHDCIFAEGALAESFLDHDCRNMFENAAEYSMLYDNEPDARSCAPRIEEGFVLAALRHRLFGPSLPQFPPGPLQGHVERIHAGWVEGWARDRANPLVPVELELVGETGPIARFPANRYRGNLAHAGLSGGRCAFSARLPQGSTQVKIRRASDGAVLPQAGMSAQNPNM